MLLRAFFGIVTCCVVFISAGAGFFKIGICGIFVGSLFFVDFILIRQVPFFKLLTALVSAITMLSIVLLVSVLVERYSLVENLVGKFPQETKSLVVLSACIVSLYYSVRVAESSNYFKRTSDVVAATGMDHLVDTSAIIDGRLLEVCEAGFLSTKLVVPEFVVQELQYISDSFSHERRKKGRRGLDLLKRMKNSDKLSVSILQLDFDFIKGVDNKLIHLCKERGSVLITNDYNLIKVAELQGIKVLSINKVATILRPMYGAGDRLKVSVLKKGSSKNQGVAYLEDDTMVVVEEGEKYIGHTKNVVVTQFIQSDSGKILFCRLGEYS